MSTAPSPDVTNEVWGGAEPALTTESLLGPVPSGLHGMLENVALTAPMVGRDAQLDVLLGALDEARAGTTRVVLVGGEAGIGKTRLVEELLSRADGFTRLVGGCVDLGDDALPFAPFATALREPMRAAGVDDLVALAASESDDRRRLYEAVTDLLEQQSKTQPIVLVIEDLHWADRSTRELLAFLTRALRDAPVLILATYRSDELHRRHPLRPFLAELSRSVTTVSVDRLNRESIDALLQLLVPRPLSADLADMFFERSDGNPFMLQELARCPDNCGLPQSLRDVMLLRVDRLDATTQSVLRVASVIGQETRHPLLAFVCAQNSVDEEQLDAALREAVDAAMLVVRDDLTYSFRHSLLREALHGDLMPGEHTRIHAAIAEALTERPDLSDPQRRALEIAHHWYAAHNLPCALEAAYFAAAEAGKIQAYAEQLKMLERVLELWPVVPQAADALETDEYSLVVAAASAAVRADDHDRVLALSDRAVVLAERADDPIRLGEALTLRGRRRLHLAASSSGADIRRALQVLPDAPSSARAKALDALAVTLMLTGEPIEALLNAELAVDMSRQVGDPRTEISGLITWGTLLIDTDDIEQGLEVMRAARSKASDIGEDLMSVRALTNLSHTLCGIGRHREAIAAAQEGLEVVSKLGLARTYSPLLAGNIADAYVRLGHLEEAEAVIAPIIAVDGLVAAGFGHMGSLSAAIAFMRGVLDRAEQLLDETDRARELAVPLPQDYLPTVQLRSAIALARGDAAAALDVAMTELQGPTAGGHMRYYWPITVVAAEAVVALATRGTTSDGTTAAVELLRARTGSDDLALGGCAEVWRAHVDALLAMLGKTASAEQWIDVAAGYGKFEEPFPQGFALLRASTLAAEQGDRGEATRLLREASDCAGRIGPGLLQSRVDAVARRLGVELDGGTGSGPTGGSTPFGLTDREAEVLRLVSAGRSNKQIADQLYISPKTASVHVSNILAKLGVSSRGEAAAFAHRNGLD